MKHSLLALSRFLELSAAATDQSSQRKPYDGYKVCRLTVGDDVAKVNNTVDKLGLPTWNGAPQAGAAADILVRTSKIDAFEAETAGMKGVTMHKNLGASIAEESTFSVYTAGSANLTWFDSYHSYSDHIQFLGDLQAQYPTRSEVVSAGNSLNVNRC
ncbi:hypothetical protein VTK56DRAFT_1487 [Thermocarpiscus australiensis]